MKVESELETASEVLASAASDRRYRFWEAADATAKAKACRLALRDSEAEYQVALEQFKNAVA